MPTFHHSKANTTAGRVQTKECPLAAGKAVSMSQGLYRIINDTIVFNNDSNCNEVSPRLAKQKRKNGMYSYIFPNPTTGFATLKFNLPENPNGTFIIYDFLSRELMRYDLKNKNHELKFDSGKFNPGIYYYSIIAEGSLIDSGKFSLIK